jgi:tRNA-binding EMAP/Myf-like protein
MPKEDLSGLCVVLYNLKAKNMGGFKSNGMVLFACSDDHK